MPNFNDLWTNFPRGTPQAVKARIGGLVNLEWIDNTCAIRISRTLNESGHDIPRRFRGMKTIRGGDNKRYAYRVAELRKYMLHRYGEPDLKHTYPKVGGSMPATFKGQRGIIMFDVPGWSNATGHFTVFDGTIKSSPGGCKDDKCYCSDTCYFKEAIEVWLWKAPLKASTATVSTNTAYLLTVSPVEGMTVEREV